MKGPTAVSFRFNGHFPGEAGLTGFTEADGFDVSAVSDFDVGDQQMLIFRFTLTFHLSPHQWSFRKTGTMGTLSSLPSPPSPLHPSLHLELGPQIQLWGLGERCKLPQRGLGRSPAEIEVGAF